MKRVPRIRLRSRFMGSAVHARSVERVSLMISIEMIGFYSDEPGSQKYPTKAMRLFYPDEGNFIAVVGRLIRRSIKTTDITPQPIFRIP